jgi:septal ring factor EnvC (AmiA/AmiB activator)
MARRRMGAAEPGRAAALALALAAAMAPAAAQTAPPDHGLRRIEKRIEDLHLRGRLLVQDRAALAGELVRLQDELVLSASRLRAIEQDLPARAARRDQLEARIAEAAAALGARQARLARLATALERAARLPPEAAALRERAPYDAPRAARLLAGAATALEAQTRALDGEIAELGAARAELAAADAALEAARAELAAGRERLEAMMSRRARLVAAIDTERAALALRAGALGREAAARRDGLERAAARRHEEAGTPAEPRAADGTTAGPARPFAEARGRALAPVEGRLSAAWGDAEGNGRIRRGLSYAAAAGATVIAPWHGTIAYAGPFRGYGAILIVESGDGYHWFIAGFDRLDVVQGQAVLAGEPLGRAAAAGGGDATIYVELRRNGQPVDPGPWLAAPNGRMTG